MCLSCNREASPWGPAQRRGGTGNGWESSTSPESNECWIIYRKQSSSIRKSEERLALSSLNLWSLSWDIKHCSHLRSFCLETGVSEIGAYSGVCSWPAWNLRGAGFGTHLAKWVSSRQMWRCSARGGSGFAARLHVPALPAPQTGTTGPRGADG